jgi:HK97 family phage major capsid protein
MSTSALRERLDALSADSTSIQAKADEAGRALTDEEMAKIDANLDEIDRLTADIARRERIEGLQQPRGRVTLPAQPKAPANPRQPQGNVDPMKFSSLGDFFKDVAASAGSGPTPRLQAAATTWAEEGTGTSAGFLVPPDFSRDIYKLVDAEFSLLSLTSQVPVSGNSLSLVTDENTAWGTGGVRVYRTAEAAAITQSRPTFKRVNVPVDKLSALSYVTDELLEDAPQLEGHLRMVVPENMDFAVANEIVWGTGSGEMLGFMNSGALVIVSAESAQTADTIKAENIFKMYARMPARHLSRAVWIINPDALPQLFGMTIGNQPIYTPANAGITQAPYGTLMGRPLIPHQVAKTIGDLGDIMFVDLSAYRVGRKSTGTRVDTSIHVEFERNMTAFRFNFRIGGQPMLSAPIDPKNGSNKLSPFVALAAR